MDHLFLHCKVARKLWVLIFRLFCVDWIIHRRVIELLVSWSGQLESCKILEVWRMAHLSLL
jgi:hypothetical protein